MSGGAFDPVVLDVTSPDDYYLLTAALEEFAADRDQRAGDEHDARPAPGSSGREDELRDQATRSRHMIAGIERRFARTAKRCPGRRAPEPLPGCARYRSWL